MARIFTISRGFGSGGRTIGKMLSEKLGIKYYDNSLIKLASEESGINEAFFGLVDEMVKKSFIKRGGKYKGGILSPSNKEYTSDANLFNFQAKIIKELAEKEPCVIVGRCADYILRDRDDVVKLLIFCDRETAVHNVMEDYGNTEKEAVKLIERTDKMRSDYYRHYTEREWTSPFNYDLCINTSGMDFAVCVDVITSYVKDTNK